MRAIDELKHILEAMPSGEGAINPDSIESVFSRLDRADKSLAQCRKVLSDLYRESRSHEGENPKRFKDFEKQLADLMHGVDSTIATLHQLQKKFK